MEALKALAIITKEEKEAGIKRFCELDINDKFHTGIEKPNYPYKDKRFMEYKKISKSQAKCINQSGYGNQRAINGVYSFAPFSRVFNI